MSKITVIDSCLICPCAEFNVSIAQWFCTHYELADFVPLEVAANKDGVVKVKPHRLCPLRKEPLIIEFKVEE